MLRRSLSILFLSLALLFVQQAAAWHALTHVGGKPAHTQQDKKMSQGEQCTKCAAFAQIGSACHSFAPALGLLPPHASHFHRLTVQFQQRYFGAYQSRAPPARV